MCMALWPFCTPLESILSGRRFGRKALETGAFIAAWAPAVSLTECQRLEALAGSQMHSPGKALCGAVSLLASSS